MSYATLVLGESGTGKTCSLRNMNPQETLLIQPIRKPLPFPSKEWKLRTKENPQGNIFVCDDPIKIIQAMQRSTHPIVVVDDWQYILSNLFMKRRNEKTYDKFTDIGGAGFDIAKVASELADNRRVYVLAHTHTDEYGKTRIKTLGRLLDDKIVVEGMFTTVLRTAIDNGKYYFSTQNSGSDTVKSPMGLFEEHLIDNDLNAVDLAICNYYDITTEETK